MYTLLNRGALASALRHLLAGTLPEPEFRAWLRAAIVGDGTDVPDQDEELVASVLDWLDAQGSSSEDLGAAAEGADRLLSAALTSAQASLLVRLARGRVRLLEVLSRLADGQLTRTAFLSFVSEQSWPAIVKQRVAGLGVVDLAVLTTALRHEDYSAVSRLVL
jgi:hypothetical protein